MDNGVELLLNHEVNNIKIKPILIYTGDNGYSWGELKDDNWLNLKAKTWNMLKEGD